LSRSAERGRSGGDTLSKRGCEGNAAWCGYGDQEVNARKVGLVAFLVWILGILAIVYAIPDPLVRHGPTMIASTHDKYYVDSYVNPEITIGTLGVFTPGGLIRFKMDPDVESINGLKAWFCTAEPNLSGSLREISWPGSQVSGGDSWGESITSSGVQEVSSFEMYLDIPNHPVLDGAIVSITLSIELAYPVPSDVPGVGLAFSTCAVVTTLNLTFTLNRDFGLPVEPWTAIRCWRCLPTEKFVTALVWFVAYPVAGIIIGAMISVRGRTKNRRRWGT
jgi:hypothetical protein